MGVNLWGVIHGIRVFVPIMLSQDTECHIVNTASLAGFLPDHPRATYQVTKHAVVALSEHLHLSLAQQTEKIKASVLCPGFVKTQIMNSGRNRPRNFQDDSSRNLPTSDEVEARWAGIQDQYNVISPAQVADVVFKSIREERFYIFTHPEFTESVQVRFENILQGKNPTPVLGSF